MKLELWPVEKLRPDPRNARLHPPAQITGIRASIEEFGWTVPILHDDHIRAGHGRRLAAMEIYENEGRIKLPNGEVLPDGHVPVLDCSGWTEAQKRAYMLADNQLTIDAAWDDAILQAELRFLADLPDPELDITVTGFSEEEIDAILNPRESTRVKSGNLADEFLIPPFSVLNARDGWWQERKRAWLALGIESEVGRGGNLIGRSLFDRIFVIAAKKLGGEKKSTRYDAIRAWVLKLREDGLTDDQIEAKAIEEFGKPRSTLARTFGQDLMRGEHVIGKSPKDVRAGNFQGGMPDTVRDMQFYNRKRAFEAKIGREVSIEEFRTMAPAEFEGTQSSTSIFDPVICELAYQWFSPDGGRVLDPFAGGSVRGVVAAALGRVYCGIDLRVEQTDANRAQWEKIAPRLRDGAIAPQWIERDSRAVLSAANEDAPPDGFDFIFSCPPYGDLEVYSDDPHDLSTMDHAEFVNSYRAIIQRAVAKLKDDRFACFVVGDFRDRQGFYRDFVSTTIRAFEDGGARLYNEAILITAAGSLAIRAGKQFRASRKLGKTHQNVLIFCKGDPVRASAACGKIDVAAAMAEFDDNPEDPQPQVKAPARSGLADDEIKISAKSARQMFIECGPTCIATGCKGNCCDAPSRPTGCMITINPDEQARIEALGGVVIDGLLQPRPGEKGCPFKSEGLCGLHQSGEKPWGCVASPFTLNKAGTLIIRNRYRMLPCFKHDGPKAPAYETFRSSLAIIFGEDETDRIVAHLAGGGGDLIAKVDPAIKAKLVQNDQIKAAARDGAKE